MAILSSEKTKETFEKVLLKIKEVVDEELGEGEYLMYLNIAWDTQTEGVNANYSSLSVLSETEREDEQQQIDQMNNLTDSLSSDPFIVSTIVQSLATDIINNKFGTTNFKSKERGSFNAMSGILNDDIN